MTPEEFRDLLISYEPQYRTKLGKLWAQAQVLSAPEFAVYAEQAYPDIITPHLQLAAELAATWYDEAPSPNKSFVATTADLAPVAQLQASLRWALSTPQSEVNLDGSATRMFHDSARRTIVLNADNEPGAKWARHAEPGACRFCQMLATRGAVYASDKQALYHGTGPRRNRGTLAPPKHTDDSYHDHCRCEAVMVRPGGSYHPPKYVEAYEQDYEKVAAAVDEAGLTRTVDNIMAAYRAMDSQ